MNAQQIMAQRKTLTREAPRTIYELSRINVMGNSERFAPYPPEHPLCHEMARLLSDMRTQPVRRRLDAQRELWALLPQAWNEIARMDVSLRIRMNRPIPPDATLYAGGAL